MSALFTNTAGASRREPPGAGGTGFNVLNQHWSSKKAHQSDPIQLLGLVGVGKHGIHSLSTQTPVEGYLFSIPNADQRHLEMETTGAIWASQNASPLLPECTARPLLPSTLPLTFTCTTTCALGGRHATCRNSPCCGVCPQTRILPSPYWDSAPPWATHKGEEIGDVPSLRLQG